MDCAPTPNQGHVSESLFHTPTRGSTPIMSRKELIPILFKPRTVLRLIAITSLVLLSSFILGIAFFILTVRLKSDLLRLSPW